MNLTWKYNLNSFKYISPCPRISHANSYYLIGTSFLYITKWWIPVIPHTRFWPSTQIYINREREREGGRERGRSWPRFDPRPSPGRFSHFRPSFRARLVPIWSLRDELRIHAILVVGKWLERRRFEFENSQPNPFSKLLISPEFGHTSSWVLLLMSPPSFSD